MKKEIIAVILCALTMTIVYILLGLIMEKELPLWVLIAMVITFITTRAFLFVIKRKKQ